MMEPAFLIPRKAMRGFSQSTQDELIAYLGVGPIAGTAASGAQPPVVAPGRAAGEEGPVELTLALVRKLTDRLSDKTLTALRIIAQSKTHQFHMKDVIYATDGAKTYMDLRGVWSALTRRTRNILDDGDAELIWWVGENIYDGKDYVDHIGEVAPPTHSALRSFFNL